MNREEPDEISRQIMELLNIHDEDEGKDIVSYLNEIDFELQRLICNLLKLREKSEPSRVTRQKIIQPVRPTRITEYYLKKAGFTIKDKNVYKCSKTYSIYEDTLMNLVDRGLFKVKSALLIVTGEKDKLKVLRAAQSHNIIFLRLEDGSLERVK